MNISYDKSKKEYVLGNTRYSKDAFIAYIQSDMLQAALLRGSSSFEIESNEENKQNETCVEGGNNVILYGVPGSGKSYYIEKNYVKDREKSERVVFHPDYTYSDFVGQILPTVEENENLKYVFNPGPFTKILKRAIKDPNDMYFLIIEELNRGNAPAIFGEIFQLLDRNDKGVSEYRITNFDIAKEIYNDKNEKIYIPVNLTILATMNTADQNVFTLDTAFQRRWIMKQIKNDFHDIKNKKQVSTVIDDGITWGDFATVINDKYIEYNRDSFSASDKRMGVYFAKASELTSRERFAEKVLKYLWDDAFKMDHTEIFSDEIETFDDLVVEYESVGEHNLKRILRSDVYEKIAKRRAVEQSKNED